MLGTEKNVCRLHGRGPLISHDLDGIGKLLYQWTDALGKEAAASCTQLALLESLPDLPSSDAGEAVDSQVEPFECLCSIIMVTVPIYSPKMEYLIRVHPDSDENKTLIFKKPDYLFFGKAFIAPCRLVRHGNWHFAAAIARRLRGRSWGAPSQPQVRVSPGIA